jgi:hypothetical protein
MIAFIYRCPRIGQQVQCCWGADHLAEGETYEPVTCIGCGRIHLVNPKTGKVPKQARCWRPAKNSPQPRVINSGSLTFSAKQKRRRDQAKAPNSLTG